MMTLEEITALLTRIQALDNRQIDELTMEAWVDAIQVGAPWLEYTDAEYAVNVHKATSTEYIQLAHITKLARAHSAARHERERRGIDEGLTYTPDTCPHVWGISGGLKSCGLCGTIETHRPDPDAWMQPA